MNLRLTPKGLVLALSVMAGLVFLLHVIAYIPVCFMGQKYPLGYLSLDGENNLPTLFSVALLWCNALLAGCIAWAVFAQYKVRVYWAFMAVLFVAAGIDEATQVHERASDIVSLYIHATGFLFYSWVLPYMALVLFLAILYIRFFILLPRDTRSYLLLAGSLYCLGAIGFEMLGARCIELHGRNAHYNIFSACEEMLEISGCIVSVYALSNHIACHLPGMCVMFSKADHADVQKTPGAYENEKG